jgi:hypothetical protein
VLKHCAANRKRRLSALPEVGSYTYDVKISGFTSAPYVYVYIYIYIYIYTQDISRLRVKEATGSIPDSGKIFDCFKEF